MNRRLTYLLFLLLSPFIAYNQCILSDIIITTQECNSDGSYDISVSSQPEDIDVDIYLNSSFLGYYELDSNGVIIDSILGTGITKDTFLICQNDLDSCCIERIINNPCLCGFANASYSLFDCVEQDSTFFIEINFVPQNNGSGFTIGGNSANYGSFEYSDLPITLGPLNADDSTDYEFIFFDSDDALCFDFIDVGLIDCGEVNACVISELSAEVLPCQTSGMFFVDLSFEVVNPGAEGFTVQGNGMNYGNFSYGQASYEIGPLLGDCMTIYEFVILDIDNIDCESDFAVLEEEVCCDQPECEIWDLSLDQACEPWFGYIINFEFANTSDQFDLYIDEMYLGTFNYADLPIMDQLGFPIFQDNLVTIEVIDSENQDCSTIEDNVEIGCDELCSIIDLFAEASTCDKSVYTVDFDFEASGTSTSFDLYVNGAFHSNYNYSQTFYTAGPFEDSCQGSIELLVVDALSNDCASNIFSLASPNCCDTIACSLGPVSIEILECDSSEMNIVLDFEYEGVTEQSFEVFSRDGFVGFFNFSDLPLTLTGFPNTGSDFEFIGICENNNQTCCIEHEWSLDGCGFKEDCLLSEVEVELVECDSLEMSFNLNFEFMDLTNDFFDVFSRDGYFGTYAFTNLPLSIDMFPNTGEDFEFIRICENGNPLCCVEHEWSLEDCGVELICEIDSIVIDPLECDTSEMSFVLDFAYANVTNDLFDVYSRDGLFGSFNFADLPLSISSFPNTGEDFEFIRICENDNEECCAEYEWLLEGCSEPLSVDDIFIDFSYQLKLNDQVSFNLRLDEIQLFDIQGRKLKQDRNRDWISVNNLNRGIYLVRLKKDGYTKVLKLLL